MANAAQKKWMETITKWYFNWGWRSGSPSYDLVGFCTLQRHHVMGRKAKHNKVAIGEWFVLPIPFIYHDVSSDHPHNVTHHKHAFTDRFGPQSELFKQMIESMVELEIDLPFGQDVINAIMDTRK
jgi:hypothetical protein